MKIEEITKKIIDELKIANEKIEFEDGTDNSEADFSENFNFKNGEEEFLNLIKERILVLFEGLNNFDKGDIEARVELNLKFMEFLLANIEKRLEDLSK